MSTVKIVAFGDSVSEGTTAKLDVFHGCFQYGTDTVNTVRDTQTWSSIMARILSDWADGGVEVVNAGIAGDTITKGVTRLERDVLSLSPDYVLILFGTEDALANIEPKSFRENLEKIVNGIAERNARPVLMTPAPISERMTVSGRTIYELRHRQERLNRLAHIVKNLAEERSLPLIGLNNYFLDNRLAYDHLFNGYFPDGVAQSAMGTFVAGELLSIMGVRNFPALTLCDYRKVYSDPENPQVMHHAFTDIAYFEGEFFVTFRKAHSHGLPTNSTLKSEVILVLRSHDGITWSEDAALKVEGMDNRDSKLLQTDERLLVYTPCIQIPHQPNRVVTYGFERLGPGKWSKPFKCAPCFFWRPRKWQDRYVVAPYAWADKDAAVKLLSSQDGRTWEAISHILPYETEGDETDLLVENGKLTAFSRAERKNKFEMLISNYIPEENRWETVSSGRIIQAPCVFKAGDRIMVSGRYCSQSDERFMELEKDWQKFTQGTSAEAAKADPVRVEEYHHGLRTGIFQMDGARPRLVMELLSAGDCSYTGVVRYGDEYVISDYSMHEYYCPIHHKGDWNTPCDIYVARIRFR